MILSPNIEDVVSHQKYPTVMLVLLVIGS